MAPARAPWSICQPRALPGLRLKRQRSGSVRRQRRCDTASTMPAERVCPLVRNRRPHHDNVWLNIKKEGRGASLLPCPVLVAARSCLERRIALNQLTQITICATRLLCPSGFHPHLQRRLRPPEPANGKKACRVMEPLRIGLARRLRCPAAHLPVVSKLGAPAPGQQRGRVSSASSKLFTWRVCVGRAAMTAPRRVWHSLTWLRRGGQALAGLGWRGAGCAPCA